VIIVAYRSVTAEYPVQSEKRREVQFDFLGVALITGGILLLVCAVRGNGGYVTASLVSALMYLFGAGTYIVPVVMIFAGSAVLTKREQCDHLSHARSLSLLFLVFLAWNHLRIPAGSELEPAFREEYGGLIGAVESLLLRKLVGQAGGCIVLAAFAVTGIVMLSGARLGDVPQGIANFCVRSFEVLARVLDKIAELCGRSRSQDLSQAAARPVRKPKRPSASVDAQGPTSTGETTGVRMTAASSPNKEHETKARSSSAKSRKPASVKGQLGLFPAATKIPPHFQMCLECLDPALPSDTKESRADSDEGVRLVEETLASFRIEAKVTQVKKGPVVTRYEVQPAPGIRVNRITNLADDLALALAAIDVRVEAPVPGKSVIGIEVPNKRVTLVRLREIVELDSFLKAPSKLTFALGKDIAGNPMFADLAKMPHLLIAGATNSGKSVCLNSIITSILARSTPEEVKFSLIDPKRVELTLYQHIPHLFHPVVVDAQGAVRALRGSIREMERRYKLFAEKGVRNIASYNSRLDEDEQPLYCVVIVIDELADLMMQAAAEFERLICRIAQLARATGIHLIIATQRPSVNVITGVIKANISSRIAFAVASQVDSRTILDVNGAERLIGQGDMLFHPIDAPKPVRIQGAFLTEDEVNRVVEILAETEAPSDTFDLNLETVEEEIAAETKGKSDEKDSLFDQALAFIRRRQQASASMLQREFEIGYPRAGRIVDQLEQAGYIGPQEGSKPRQVLTGHLEGDIVEGEEPELVSLETHPIAG